ncbi:DUF3152 domain-containing protein [Kribbella ginsengisoli]|uniref:DUF3152 domain-containing protein n=1 Tax=Kribbella ginsengisoli TaxID=363865 RepID=A0ABP6XR56_9ACTN
MRKTRIAALGIVGAVAVVALLQLPASPFSRQEHPERPVAQTSTQPKKAASPKSTPTGKAPEPETPAEPGAPAESKTPEVPASPQSNSAPGQGDPGVTYPVRGTVDFTTLPGNPATIGRAGKLFTFQIQIEGGIKGIDQAAFASFVRETYGAPEGWASAGKYRFRQVGPGQAADFKLMLVTPATRDTYCGGGFDQYTSCRIGERVVLNVARWAKGVPNYGASLTTYREYMINHETGHRLGNAHELCPGPGQPAPVMQQQTLGLHGCTAYPWPYRNGQRYEGQLGKYDDPTPSN